MRYRFILPLANIVLGVLLFHLGDLQVRRIRERYGSYEGTQDAAATGKYVHYALNAPVWVLVEKRGMLWSPSTYWTGRDLRYFLAATVMWFLIGLKLDRRRRRTGAERASEKIWWRRVLAFAFVVYGLIVGYAVLPQPYFGPLKDYLRILLAQCRDFAWWYGLGLAWGVGLVVAGLRLMFRPGKPALGQL